MLALVICSTRAHSFELDFSKEQKALIANAGGFAVITVWGVAFWDYGQRSLGFASEGWFGKGTKEGGADKLGHLFSTYAMTRGFAHIYTSWGYSHGQAALFGTLSSVGLMAYGEFGDSFSRYGFSYEDLLMNFAGGLIGCLFFQHPGIADKLDLRWEYEPNLDECDVFTDYEHSKYLVALKLSGFERLRGTCLKYLELQFGYYARGYSDDEPDRSRNIYGGIGINIAQILHDLDFKKISVLFNYYQTPCTYVSYSHDLN